MEGDCGVVEIAQALKDAGLLFTVDGCCRSRKTSPFIEIKYSSEQHRWMASKAAQTSYVDHNHYQVTPCHISSRLPIRSDHSHNNRSYLCHNHSLLVNKSTSCYRDNAFRLARGYESSVLLPIAPIYKTRTSQETDVFASSLRKYPKSPERSTSADFIQRLLTYKQQKNDHSYRRPAGVENGSASPRRSPRRNRRRAATRCHPVYGLMIRNSYTSRSQWSLPRRSRDPDIVSSPYAKTQRRGIYHQNKAVKTLERPLERPLSPRRNEFRNERNSISPSYDYLESPTRRLSASRVSEVHYLDDLSRFVRESLRSFSPRQPESGPCPTLSSRYMEHKKRCPKANTSANNAAGGSKKQRSSISVDSGAQTCASPDENYSMRPQRSESQMTSQSVQADRSKLLDESRNTTPCECENYSFRKPIRVPPPICESPFAMTCFENDQYLEWMDEKIEGIVNDWMKTIPVNGDFDEEDKEIRKFLAKDLKDKIVSLINNNDFEKTAKVEILDTLSKMPMWYPDDHKDEFRAKMAANLSSKLDDIAMILRNFDKLFEAWFKDLKFKPTDAYGMKVDKKKIKAQISNSIKPIVIDQLIEHEFKNNLKSETVNIIEDLPYDVKGNQNEYVKEISDKLIDCFINKERSGGQDEKRTTKKRKSSDSQTGKEGNDSKVVNSKGAPSTSKRRKSRSNEDKTNTNNSRNSEDLNVSLTLSSPSYESKTSKISEINKIICDWVATIPELSEMCLNEDKQVTVKELAMHVVQIEKESVENNIIKDTLKEEVMTWLGDVVEKEKIELKPKSILKYTNDLVDKIERVYLVPLDEIKGEEESDMSFDYFDDEVTDWFQEMNDLPNELLKPEHQGPILKLAKDFRDLQDANGETVRNHFKGEIQNWLDRALSKEKLKMDSKTQNFVIGDLLKRLNDAKAGNFELNNLEDEFTHEILGWVVNIPQISKVKDNEKYQNIVKLLAKDLNVLQRRHGVDASDARGLILGKIDDFLETTLKNEGEEIDESEKKRLLEDLLTNLIQKSKKHSVAAIYRQKIKDWLDDSPELEEISGKDEFQRPIAKLAGKIADLHKECETDADVKHEIKDEVQLWLSKVIKKEKVQMHPSNRSKMIDNLMEALDNIDENRLDAQARSFENEIIKWLDNIPETANLTNNEAFKNEIKDLARDINMFQRRQGIDATDMKDLILSRLRGFLDNALNVEGGQLSDQDKDKFLNKLLSNLVESSKKPDETIKDKIHKEVKDWLDNIPELANTSKKKAAKEMIRKLVSELNESQEDGIENMVVREEFFGKLQKFFNLILDMEKVNITGKAKKQLINDLMDRLENLVKKTSVEPVQNEIVEEEESDDDIPSWLDEVPGLDDAIKKRKYKKPKTLTMMTKIMSQSNIEYDFNELIDKYFNDGPSVYYTVDDNDQKLFRSISKKLQNGDDEFKDEIENDIKDYIDVICKKRHRYLDSKTKSKIANRLIAKARLRLEKERIAYNTSRNLMYSLRTWSSLLSMDFDQIVDTDSSVSDKYGGNSRKHWNKDIGFQFSSSDTDNNSRNSSPVKVKSRHRMNFDEFVAKQMHAKSNTLADSFRRPLAGTEQLPIAPVEASTSHASQPRTYINSNKINNNSGKESPPNKQFRSNLIDSYPNEKLDRFKAKPSTGIYYVDQQIKDTKAKKQNELSKQLLKIEKDAKRSISNAVEKGKYKLTTANSNQVKTEIIDILIRKVGLLEVEAWPLAETIIKKAKSVYKNSDDVFDLRELIRDEMRDVLDEAGITTRRDELETLLTDLLADEITFGEVDNTTCTTVFKILRSADVHDPLANNITSQVIDKANEISEKVKSNKYGLRLTPETFRDIAEREITEFVEGKIEDLTPDIKGKICEVTPHLIERLECIISDSSKTPSDKTYAMKSEIKSYLRKLSLNETEDENTMSDKLIGRLYVRMNPTHSRNQKTALFRMSTDAGASNDTMVPLSKKQEFQKLAAKVITDFLDEKCKHMTKDEREKLFKPTGKLLEELGDIVVDNKIARSDKRQHVKLNLDKFFSNLPIDIEDNAEECSKQLMFRLDTILPDLIERLHSMDNTPSMPLKNQYSRRMSIAVPRTSISNEGVHTYKNPNTEQNKASNSNTDQRRSSNSEENKRSNSNTEQNKKSASETDNSKSGLKTDHQKGSNPNTPRNSESQQHDPDDESAEKELLEYILTKIRDVSPQEKEHIKTSTSQLVKIARTAIRDPELTIEDKIEQLKDSISQYLRLIPLLDDEQEEEIAARILSKLEIKMFHRGFTTSTPRSSLYCNENDVIKTNEQCYLNQLHDIVENWMLELPIIQYALTDTKLKQTMVDNLVSDINDRQKYLQLNVEMKPFNEEEIENLKYQIFRWLNKFLGIDDLSPFLSNIANLLQRISRVPVPSLVKPSSKAFQEEISKFIEQIPPNLLTTDDRIYQQQGIKELADRLICDVEKVDANPRIDNDIQNWIPKMFTGNMQDLSRLSDMLRSSLKKKGLLESKLDKLNKKATDILNDSIENWCDDLPLYGSLEEQDKIKMIKNNLGSKLIHKVAQLNLNPEIFNDEFLYEDILTDEIDKLTEWLPKNPELDKYLPALKKDLILQIKYARQNLMEEIAGQAFKHQLRDVISNTLKTSEILTNEDLVSLELIKENLADAFISMQYVCDSVEGRRLLKDKIENEINKFCYDFFRRHPMCSFNATKINCDLYEALLNVTLPTDGSIRVEIEQLYIKNIIKEWTRELPLKEENGRELLQRAKIVTILTKRLYDIEQEKKINPNLDNNTKMCEEITKWTKKISLKPGNEPDLPKLALKLVERLQQTEKSRYLLINQSVEESTNKTMEESICPCSSMQMTCGKPVVQPIPPCGLSLSDKIFLQRIRDRVRTRTAGCCKDTCINPSPVDNASQIDILINHPRPCERPTYDTCSGRRLVPKIGGCYDPICPNLRQSSTQTSPCVQRLPSHEICPQVIIREHSWGSPDSSKIAGVCPRKSLLQESSNSGKTSPQKNKVQDNMNQDNTPSPTLKDQSCQCKCDKCNQVKCLNDLKTATQKSPQRETSSDGYADNPSSYEPCEDDRLCGRISRVRRCRPKNRDKSGECSIIRRNEDLGYWDDNRPVLRPNILNIPADVDPCMRGLKLCECEEKRKPRRSGRSGERRYRSEQYRVCPKCLSNSCPYPSFMYFR